ncbi:MAG TPA: hypothetical protein VF783_20865 [Terriglobales bacterium]
MNKQTAYSSYLVALNFGSAEGGSQANTLQANPTDAQVTAGRENAKRQLRSLLHTRFVVPE